MKNFQGIERLPFDNIIGGKKPPPTAGHELPMPRSQFAVQPWSYMGSDAQDTFRR